MNTFHSVRCELSLSLYIFSPHEMRWIRKQQQLNELKMAL